MLGGADMAKNKLNLKTNSNEDRENFKVNHLSIYKNNRYKNNRYNSPFLSRSYHNNNYIHNNNLGYYLAGLIEGDGYISINNKNILTIAITFNIKDSPLAKKLILFLGKGYGFLAKRKTNSIELRFTNKKSLLYIISIINGKFRTPKIDQLYKAIDYVNKNYSLNIDKNNLDDSNILTNA
jgi:hypothetical protein